MYTGSNMIDDLRIIRVDRLDHANGDGLGVAVWMYGCHWQCNKCHNPDTWKWSKSKGVGLNDKIIDKILNACDVPQIKRMTLTGGDPLFPKSREGVEYLCKKFRERFGNTKSIWLWTGYLWEDIKDLPLINYVDIVVDGKYEDHLRVPNLKYRGSTNQRVIDCKTGRDIANEI